MFKNILVLNFSDECVAVDAQSLRSIKSYSPLLSNVSPCRIKMLFWHKICCFWVQEFFQTHTFFYAGHYFDLKKKGREHFWLLEKGRAHFWLLKKGQGAAPSEKRKTWTLVKDSLELGIIKRHVLRITSKIFDPCRFISPYVIRIKILMQEL